MTKPLVGIAGPATLTETRRDRGALLSAIHNSSIDHLVVDDHVSFHDGFGFDGLINGEAALCKNSFLGLFGHARHHQVVTRRR